MTNRSWVASFFVAGFLLTGGISSRSSAAVAEDQGWDFRAQIAFSPLAVDAQSTVNGQSASFVTNSNEFMSLDTSGVKIRIEGWKGRWGLTADNTLAYFSAESRIDPANTVKLSGHDFSTELGGSYVLGTQKLSSTKLQYEGMGGARIVSLEQELEFSSGVQESDTKNYVDPYIGARVTWVVGRHASFDVRGNVGGFGIGSGSELTWMIQPEFNLHLSKSVLVNVGYRHYDVQTEKETGTTPTKFDGAIYGTFVGMEIRFSDHSQKGDEL